MVKFISIFTVLIFTLGRDYIYIGNENRAEKIIQFSATNS